MENNFEDQMQEEQMFPTVEPTDEELAEIEMAEFEEPGEDNLTDAEADADTLASAGMGTDEDYGSFGGEDSFLDGSYEM